MNLETTKKAYNEILKAMKKHKENNIWIILTCGRRGAGHPGPALRCLPSPQLRGEAHGRRSWQGQRQCQRREPNEG